MSHELEHLRDQLRHFAAARAWGPSHSPRNLALALTGEVGELSAELQWIDDCRMQDHLADATAKARISDEVADVLIYLVQFADACGIDPLVAAHGKIARNEQRYPPKDSLRNATIRKLAPSEQP